MPPGDSSWRASDRFVSEQPVCLQTLPPVSHFHETGVSAWLSAAVRAWPRVRLQPPGEETVQDAHATLPPYPHSLHVVPLRAAWGACLVAKLLTTQTAAAAGACLAATVRSRTSPEPQGEQKGPPPCCTQTPTWPGRGSFIQALPCLLDAESWGCLPEML